MRTNDEKIRTNDEKMNGKCSKNALQMMCMLVSSTVLACYYSRGITPTTVNHAHKTQQRQGKCAAVVVG